MQAIVTINEQSYTAHFDRPHDLSIRVAPYADTHLNAFYLDPPKITPVRGGDFVGCVAENGSCNCATITFCPHGNGTHTEGIGHLTGENVSVDTVVQPVLTPATLVHLAPKPIGSEQVTYPCHPPQDDVCVTKAILKDALEGQVYWKGEFKQALIIATHAGDERSSSNTPETAHWSGSNPPYLTVEAAKWLREQGVKRLVIDLPSMDRENDGGHLAAHHAFFGVNKEDTKGHCNPGSLLHDKSTCITELANVSKDIPNGPYLLNLQVAPFHTDAAPSRPLLIPIDPHK